MSSQPPDPHEPADPFAHELRDAALAPLEELIEAYRQHGEFVSDLIAELSRVVDNITTTFERRPGLRSTAGRQEAAAPSPSEPTVELRLRDTEELLEFIDNLGRVPGVSRISVIAPGPGRATLLVVLEEEDLNADEETDDSFRSSEQV